MWSNSSQLSQPIQLKFSGSVGGHTGSAYLKNQPDPPKYVKFSLIGTIVSFSGKACRGWKSGVGAWGMVGDIYPFLFPRTPRLLNYRNNYIYIYEKIYEEIILYIYIYSPQ